LIMRVSDADGRLVDVPQPESAGRVAGRQEYPDLVRSGVAGVGGEPHGTGGRARVRGGRVAGETGAARGGGVKRHDGLDDDAVAFEFRDHAWFVGFAPAEAPEIVVAALMEHGGHGGSAAAPLVQRVLARYFEKRAVQNVPAQVAWVGGGKGGQ